VNETVKGEQGLVIIELFVNHKEARGRGMALKNAAVEFVEKWLKETAPNSPRVFTGDYRPGESMEEFQRRAEDKRREAE
jgi:hypothetical protein